MFFSRNISIWILLSLFLLSSGVHAATSAEQIEGAKEFDALIDSWTETLETVETQVSDQSVDREEIATLSKKIRDVREAASKERADTTKLVKAQKDLLSAIPEAPTDGEFEDASAAQQREVMQKRLAHLEGRVQRCDVILARSEAVLADMAKAGHKSLINELMIQGPIPILPKVIGSAIKQLPLALKQSTKSLSSYWKKIVAGESLVMRQPVGFLVLLVLSGLALTIGIRASRRYLTLDSPSHGQKLMLVACDLLYRALAPVFALSALYFLVSVESDSSEARNYGFIFTVLLVQSVVTLGFSHAFLSPQRSKWRISEFSDSAAVFLHKAIIWFVLIRIVIVFIAIITDLPNNQAELGAVVSLGIVLLAATAILRLSRTRNWTYLRSINDEDVTHPPKSSTQMFMRVVQMVVIIGVVASLAGYRNLAKYLIYDTGWTLILLGLALTMRTLFVSSLNQLSEPESKTGNWLCRVFVTSTERLSKVVFWLLLLIDIVLIFVVGIVLLLLWGVSIADIEHYGVRYLSGISIGEWKFSFLDLGKAVAIFIAVLLFFRFVVKVLFRRIFEHTGFDVGVRDAFTTILSYTGVVFATVVAFTTLGFSFRETCANCRGVVRWYRFRITNGSRKLCFRFNFVSAKTDKGGGLDRHRSTSGVR